MADIFSIFRKLGFTGGADDETGEDERYEQDDEEEEEQEEEEQEEGSGLFGFSFRIPGLNFVKKNADEDEDDEEEADEEEDEEEEDEERTFRQPKAKTTRSGKVIDLKKSKERKSDGGQARNAGAHCEHIFVVRQLQDSRTIITHLHDGDSIVLNLENIDPKDCGRVIDLLSGAAFALGGSITKVSRLTYLLAPGTVRVVPPQGTPSASNRFTM